MTVYVDLLFGLNTAINYLLLRGSAALGGCPVKLQRLLAAAVIGGLYAVAAVLPGLDYMQTLGFQAICAGLMLLVAFGWKKHTVKQGVFFFGLSFAFSGAVLLLVQLVEPDCLFLGGRAYYALTTPALLLLAGLSYGVAAAVLAGCGTHTGGDITTLTLELNANTVMLRALRDTGNTLRDPLTGQTVLVTNCAALQQLLPEASVTEAQLRDPAGLLPELTRAFPKQRFRLLPYRAVGVECGMLLAVRCTLRYKSSAEQISVAFSPTDVSADGRFDALWGGEIL